MLYFFFSSAVTSNIKISGYIKWDISVATEDQGYIKEDNA